MTSMQWQLGILGTISAFAYRHRETKKKLFRGGRSQDLPNTDFQPAVRHLKLKTNIINKFFFFVNVDFSSLRGTKKGLSCENIRI